jgi:hypothetical protein
MYHLNHLTILDRITNLPQHVVKVILGNSHVLLNQIHIAKWLESVLGDRVL